jgi:acyl carrier protein
VPAETHVGRDRPGRDEVLRCVREQVALVLEIDEAEAAPGSRLVEDLGADELALIDVVEAIEAELGERTVGFTVADEDLGDVRTVADLVDVVAARLERAT